MMTSLLLGISMIVVVVGILMMNQTSSYDTQIRDRGAIAFLLPFFYIMHSPFAVAGIRELCYCSSGLFVAARSDSVLYFTEVL